MSWSAPEVLGTMTDIVQVLSRRDELNEMAFKPKNEKLKRAREPKLATPHTQQEQGTGAFASMSQQKTFDGEDARWKQWGKVFCSSSGRFLGHWQTFANTLSLTEMSKQP